MKKELEQKNMRYINLEKEYYSLK